MITGIEIRGFRGIEKCVLRDLTYVTIIIGKNSSGKSSILEALYLVSAAVEPDDPIRRISKLDYVVSRHGGRGDWDTIRRVLWYVGNTKKPIEIVVEFKGERYRFEVHDRPKLESPILLYVDGRPIALGRRGWEEWKVMLPRSFIELGEFIKRVLFIDDVLMRTPKVVEDYAFDEIKSRRLDKEVIKLVKEEFEPSAEGLSYSPRGYLMLDTSETSIRVDDLADGARSALLTAMLIYASKPRLVLVEEPEIHMHPGGLYTYLRFLLRLAKEMEFQVILSTHSIELIQFVEEISREMNVDTTIQFIEREKGIVEVRRITSKDSELLRKLGIDVRFLYKF